MASAADALDALFSELDLSLTNSRNIFSQIPASSADVAEGNLARNSALSVSHQSSAQTQSASDTADLQVPAYVHVGAPLVTEEPTISQVAVGDATIDWYVIVSAECLLVPNGVACLIVELVRHILDPL